MLGCSSSKLLANNAMHLERMYVVKQNIALLSQSACVGLIGAEKLAMSLSVAANT